MRGTARALTGAAACGVSLVVLTPVIARVYGDLGPVMHVPVGWLVVAVLGETAGFVAGWVCLRVALRADKWTTVIVPDLAGNAATNVLPAGAAIGAVVQLRMLSRFGVGLTRSVTALAASALLTTVAGLATFAMLAVVSIMTGAAVSASTVEFAGASLVVMGALVLVAFKSERPMLAFARSCESAIRRVPRCRCPENLAATIVRERDEIGAALVERKVTIVLASMGRTVGDYVALYAAVLATGARPGPGVVLVALIAANAAGMVPLTPGGLGFVEAGTSGALVVAGLGQEQAILAVAIYRLVSCWLPVAAGAVAYAYERLRPSVQNEKRDESMTRPSPRLLREPVSSAA
jgi:uncharacterized protein (TIRG00374 family)